MSWQPEEETEETDPTRLKTEVDNYTGVSIQVSFNSKHNEGQRISQLSGGQKSLVALATGKLSHAPRIEADTSQSSQFRNVTPRHSTSLTKSMPTWIPNTELP